MNDLDRFKESKMGQSLHLLFRNQRIIDSMKTLSNHGYPAIQEFGKIFAEFKYELDAGEIRGVELCVREIMEKNDYEVIGSGAPVESGYLFDVGDVYGARQV